MTPENSQLEKGFLRKWIWVTGIAWPAGIIVSIIVAHIVNIVYPKETNLVVGLCVGAVVGYSQWSVLKKQTQVGSFWGLACSIGMGVPFVLVVILDEVGVEVPDSTNVESLGRIAIGLIGGLLSGLLQVRVLRNHYAKACWWMLVSAAGWGLCWLVCSIGPPWVAVTGFLSGGIILGLVTGLGLLWIQENSLQRERDTLDSTNL